MLANNCGGWGDGSLGVLGLTFRCFACTVSCCAVLEVLLNAFVHSYLRGQLAEASTDAYQHAACTSVEHRVPLPYLYVRCINCSAHGMPCSCSFVRVCSCAATTCSSISLSTTLSTVLFGQHGCLSDVLCRYQSGVILQIVWL